MTVSSTTTKVSYSGNGSTTVFAYTFKIFADADLTVIVRTDATGAESTKTLTTDYTVSGAGNAGGGAVTMVTAPASGETLVIKRSLTLTQSTDYVANDPFPAAAHEDALDRLTFIAQQQQEVFDRAVVFPETDTASTTIPDSVTRANKFLGFGASGEVAVLSSTGTAPGAIDTNNLVDGAVTTAKLASTAVTTAKITDDAVTQAKIADDAVGQAQIADDAVGSAQIADDAVGSAQIADDAVTVAKININGGELVLDADGDTSITADTDDQIDFKTGGIDRITIDSSGNLNMTGAGSGNITIRNGNGIDFSASEGGGATSSILDDYEEGTWTATLGGSTTNPSTPVTVTGTYIKVGRLVWADALFSNVNTTGASGVVKVTGMPFSSDRTNPSGDVMAHTLFDTTATASASNITPLFVSGTEVQFYQTFDSGGWAAVQHNGSGAGRYLYFSLNYTTA